MEFNVPKTHELFRQMIREFVEKEVKPIAAEVDENERFPMETVEKMAKIGIMGIPIPKQYGGAGGDNLMYAMAVEELSKACATTGVIVSAHTSLGTWPILKFGNEKQKQKYLPNVYYVLDFKILILQSQEKNGNYKCFFLDFTKYLNM